jgi:hypothetical protein
MFVGVMPHLFGASAAARGRSASVRRWAALTVVESVSRGRSVRPLEDQRGYDVKIADTRLVCPQLLTVDEFLESLGSRCKS